MLYSVVHPIEDSIHAYRLNEMKVTSDALTLYHNAGCICTVYMQVCNLLNTTVAMSGVLPTSEVRHSDGPQFKNGELRNLRRRFRVGLISIRVGLIMIFHACSC